MGKEHHCNKNRSLDDSVTAAAKAASAEFRSGTDDTFSDACASDATTTTKSTSSCCPSCDPHEEDNEKDESRRRKRTIFNNKNQKGILKFKTVPESLQHRYGTVNKDENHPTFAAAATTTTPFEMEAPTIARIHFSTVTVHYHNTLLSDNPSVSSGPPLCLGHDCLCQDVFASIDEAQQQGALAAAAWGTGKNRLLIPAKVRERMLLKAGVSKKDIKRSVILQKLQQRQALMGSPYRF